MGMRGASWFGVGAIALVVAIGGVFLVWSGSGNHGATVPGVVFADGDSGRTNPQTRQAALDEMRYIEAEGFKLPPLSLSFVRPLDWNGITAISQQPTRYSVVIVDWAFANDKQTHRVMAHELGHVLLAEKGLVQSEALADGFSVCYGSPAAQTGAQQMSITADCDAIRTVYE